MESAFGCTIKFVFNSRFNEDAVEDLMSNKVNKWFIKTEHLIYHIIERNNSQEKEYRVSNCSAVAAYLN